METCDKACDIASAQYIACPFPFPASKALRYFAPEKTQRIGGMRKPSRVGKEYPVTEIVSLLPPFLP
jgi:hypothetical protein